MPRNLHLGAEDHYVIGVLGKLQKAIFKYQMAINKENTKPATIERLREELRDVAGEVAWEE